jgi:hypothetical protein
MENPQAAPSRMKDRFEKPIDACDVVNKGLLESYRAHWRKWMSWYDHDPDEPHSIEQQIQQMLFNDLVYRSLTSARENVPNTIEVSARTGTLVYLLDSGYVTTQVLAISKLLDDRKDVISVMRLLKDVERHRDVITRENYVSGRGYPYDPTPVHDGPTQTRDENFGLSLPGQGDWIYSHHLHEQFDRLTGKNPSNRSRDDRIPKSVFKRLHEWLGSASIKRLDFVRDKYLAHSSNAAQRNGEKFQGIRFTEIDEAQRAIVRVERVLSDLILARQIARSVVPLPPLGLFSNLDIPYATRAAQEAMYQRWDELTKERDDWRWGLLDELLPKTEETEDEPERQL